MLQVKKTLFFALGAAVAGEPPGAISGSNVGAGRGRIVAPWMPGARRIRSTKIDPFASVHFDLKAIHEVSEALRAGISRGGVMVAPGGGRPQCFEHFDICPRRIAAALWDAEELGYCRPWWADAPCQIWSHHDQALPALISAMYQSSILRDGWSGLRLTYRGCCFAVSMISSFFSVVNRVGLSMIDHAPMVARAIATVDIWPFVESTNRDRSQN